MAIRWARLPQGRRGARRRKRSTRQWGEALIKSWNEHGWFDLPRKIGDRIGETDRRTIGERRCLRHDLGQSLQAARRGARACGPDRRVILSDTGNFPTDLYMMQGLIRLLDRDLELRLVEPEEVEAAIDR